MTRAFSAAISGLSQSNSSTYAQVFTAITVIVFTFLFLFGRFKKEDSIHYSRALMWESVHFPLHFCLLLLLAAMVVSWQRQKHFAHFQNFIIVVSYAEGISAVSDQFYNQFTKVLNSSDGISEQDRMEIAKYLAKLPLLPGFEQEYDIIKTSVDNSNRRGAGLP